MRRWSPLQKDLAAQFAAGVANPDGVPPGATVFPATAVLGDSVPDPDPATLVGQEVSSFTLACRPPARSWPSTRAP